MTKPKRIYTLPHEDPRVVDDAPSAFENTVLSRRDPETTFHALTDLSLEATWFPDFVDSAWETPLPHGVGSIRWYQTETVWLREHFLRWEPGRRLTFAASAISLPFVTTFGEDYRLTPTSEGTRVDWRVTYTTRPLFKVAQPIIRPFFGRTFRVAAERLEAALRSEPESASKDREFAAAGGLRPSSDETSAVGR